MNSSPFRPWLIALAAGMILATAWLLFEAVAGVLLGRQVEKAGFPMTTPQLAAAAEYTPSTPTQALAVKEAITLWTPSTRQEDELMGVAGIGRRCWLDAAADPAQATAAANYASRNTLLFQAIARIADFHDFRPPLPRPVDDPEAVVRNLPPALTLTRLYAERIEAAVADRDINTATDALIDGFRLQDMLSQTPDYYYHRQFRECNEVWLRSFSRALNGVYLPEDCLQRLLLLLNRREQDFRRQFDLVVRSELLHFFLLADRHLAYAAATDEFWSRIELGGSPRQSWRLKLRLWSGEYLEKRAMFHNVAAIRDEKLADFDNYPNARPGWEKWQRQQHWYTPFVRYYGDPHQLYLDDLATVAQLRIARAAAAAVLYQRQNQKFPEAVTDLAPDFLSRSELIDPFTGQPLRLKNDRFQALMQEKMTKDGLTLVASRRSGLRIYSAGPDGKDNGGNSLAGLVRGKNFTDDITAIVLADGAAFRDLRKNLGNVLLNLKYRNPEWEGTYVLEGNRLLLGNRKPGETVNGKTAYRAVLGHISDLTPLRGYALDELWLNRTEVSDLTPLRGLPLKRLSLRDCPVTSASLKALRNLPLEYLDLSGCRRVDDISALAGLPLKNLYLNNTMVEDIAPLKGMKLEVLELERTAIVDLSPLKGMPLQILKINYTDVRSLAPLNGMRLKMLWLQNAPCAKRELPPDLIVDGITVR